MIRKPTDKCLLCKDNLAVKENSHIIPKFLSTKFLGPKNKRKGFEVSSNMSVNQKPKIIQDSPKENYILCNDCEKFFSILERISSDTFTKWKEKVERKEFILSFILKDLSMIDCRNSDKRTIKLLLYSIFWRASISNITTFNNIKIEPNFEEKLREILFIYRSISESEYLLLLDKYPVFNVFPISIVTADTFSDETSNILCAPPFEGAYKLIIDKFCFLLLKNYFDIPVDFFKVRSNVSIDDCQIILFSENYWKNNVTQPIIDTLSELYVKNNL